MSRCALTAVLALLAVADASPALAGKKYALLVGINEYQHRKLRPLRYAEADVKELADVLKKAGYQTTVLTGSAPDDDLKATKKCIEKHLEAIMLKCKKGDLVVVAFSGHGMQFEKKAKDDPEVAYFCPVDARPFPRYRSTMVSLNLVYQQMEASFDGLKLLLVDACRDDPDVARGSKGGVTGDSLPPPEGVAALFSCKAGERSWENDKLKHSVFFHHVLQCLKGEVRAADGKASFLWLSRHVMKSVQATVPKLVTGQAQSPELKSNISDDPVLLIQPLKIVRRGPENEPIEPPKPKPKPKPFNNAIGLVLVRIEAGTFWMGSPTDEKGRDDDDDERQHSVRISQAFYLGKYPVTVGQFKAFVRDDGYQTEAETDGEGGMGFTGRGNPPFKHSTAYSWRATGFYQDDSYPVVNVTWKDARKFCEWLSQKEGKKYRLPTEAEWEYACRAGTTTRYYCGSSEWGLSRVANLADRSLRQKWPKLTSANPWNDDYPFTSPVGTFKPNRWGLYDMHGNVWQWCADVYGKDYYNRGPQQDPKGPWTGKERVRRGGSWFSDHRDCRCASRGHLEPIDRFNDTGFRVVCESAPDGQ
jgi:formylglycine-generating enzyme required for sulfatase activity